jgi:hypothetical protein
MKTIQLSSLIIVSVIAMGVSSARADQPHMRAALHSLREARAQLMTAEHNKGGWRERALQNVDRAIQEVQNGMAVAR